MILTVSVDVTFFLGVVVSDDEDLVGFTDFLSVDAVADVDVDDNFFGCSLSVVVVDDSCWDDF